MRRSISVLYVTDGGDTAERIAPALEEASDAISVDRVESGERALECLDDSEIDCVLSDAELPDRDGVALLAALREDHPDLPYVLLSESPGEVAKRALSAGATDCVGANGDAADYRLLANRVENAARARNGRTSTAGCGDLAEELPDGVLAIDETETVREANDAMGEALGVEVDGLLGRSLPDLVEAGLLGEDYLTGYRKAVEAVQSGETETARFEFGVSRDGELRTYEARHVSRPGDAFRGTVGTIRDVTDRVARETELERYETLLRTIPDTVVVTDNDGYHVEVHGFEGWSGYTREELVGEHISMTMPEEYREQAESVAAELFGDDEREKATYEMVVETKDGERIPFENHLTLLPPDEDGRIPGSMSILRDITERREREHQLELYETAVEATHDSVAVIDEHGEHLLVNGVYANAFGRSREEFEGRSVEDLAIEELAFEVPDDFEDRWVHAWATAHEEGQAEFRYESTIKLDRGMTVLDNRVTAMKREDGTVIYVVVGRDVTAQRERQRQIERLHRSTRELMAAESKDDVAREVVEAVDTTLGFPANVVRLVDDAGESLEPVTVTDRARELLGDRTSIQIEGNSLGEAFLSGEVVLLDDLRERTEEWADSDVRSLLSVPIGDYGMLSIVDEEVGAYDESDVRIAEIMAANAEAAFDRVEREAALRDRERALSRQIDRLDQFASIVSHDLRNPLNVAKGHLTFVEQQVDDREHVETVGGALDRMNAIIEDVLTLARKGDEATDVGPVDLRATVESCWGNVDTADATLEADADRSVLADESRLQQLFENLIRNGIDHVGDDVTIRVGDLADGFYVEDDGPGIPEAEREKVFETGYSTGSHGTGFGLNIVDTIAEAHEWTVVVTDGTDGGARFEFTDVEFADE